MSFYAAGCQQVVQIVAFKVLGRMSKELAETVGDDENDIVSQ